jgi:hypothetical protein
VITSPTTTFKQQAQWWLDEMRARIVSRKKRRPIKPATLAGYRGRKQLNEAIGSTPWLASRMKLQSNLSQNESCEAGRQDGRQLLPSR